MTIATSRTPSLKTALCAWSKLLTQLRLHLFLFFALVCAGNGFVIAYFSMCCYHSNRVTRGIPSDLASLNSVTTSGGASVMGMFNTTALYHDPLLDNSNPYGSGSAMGAIGSSRGRGPPATAGVKTGAAAGRRDFDTASLRSQDDTARYIFV